MGPAPKTRIMVALGEDEQQERVGRILEGHELTLVSRIVDCLILIDGDLQHVARATGDRAPAPLHLERRGSRG